MPRTAEERVIQTLATRRSHVFDDPSSYLDGAKDALALLREEVAGEARESS